MSVATTRGTDTDATEQYVGAVLALGEQYIGDGESSYYAVCWDGEKAIHVGYSTSHPLDTRRGHAQVDATDAVRTQYAAYLAKSIYEHKCNEALAKALEPEVGKTVRVIKGRKVPKGIEGRIFWARMQEGRAWYMPREYRIGIETQDGVRFFLSAANTEVVDPEEYMPSFLDLEFRADIEAMRKAFYAKDFGCEGIAKNQALESYVTSRVSEWYPERLVA